MHALDGSGPATTQRCTAFRCSQAAMARPCEVGSGGTPESASAARSSGKEAGERIDDARRLGAAVDRDADPDGRLHSALDLFGAEQFCGC